MLAFPKDNAYRWVSQPAVAGNVDLRRSAWVDVSAPAGLGAGAPAAAAGVPEASGGSRRGFAAAAGAGAAEAAGRSPTGNGAVSETPRVARSPRGVTALWGCP